MDATVIQEGKAIDYTPAGAVGAGAIVDLGELLGVAPEPIAASVAGALLLEGVFSLTKDGTSGPVFEIGDAVFWDTVNSLAVRTGGSGCLYFGTCTEAAAAGVAGVKAELRPHDLPGWMADMLWEDVDLTSAGLTLDIQDCGKVLNVIAGDATFTNAIVFPACVAGYRFCVRCGTDGETFLLDPDVTVSADKFAGPDIAGTAGKGRVLTAATAKKGDYAAIEFGGTDIWLIAAQRGVWTEEA
jgi:predicted RecA/RadA family phage recombinase